MKSRKQEIIFELKADPKIVSAADRYEINIEHLISAIEEVTQQQKPGSWQNTYPKAMVKRVAKYAILKEQGSVSLAVLFAA